MARWSSIPRLSSISINCPTPCLTTYGLLPTELPEKAFTNSNQIKKKKNPKSNQITLLSCSKPSNGSPSHTSPILSEIQIFFPFNSPCDRPSAVGPTLLSFHSSLHSLCSRSAPRCSQFGQPFSISRLSSMVPTAPSPLKAYDSSSYFIQVSAPMSPPQRGFMTTMYDHHTTIFPSIIFLLSTQHPSHVKYLPPSTWTPWDQGLLHWVHCTIPSSLSMSST